MTGSRPGPLHIAISPGAVAWHVSEKEEGGGGRREERAPSQVVGRRVPYRHPVLPLALP